MKQCMYRTFIKEDRTQKNNSRKKFSFSQIFQNFNNYFRINYKKVTKNGYKMYSLEPDWSQCLEERIQRKKDF